MIILFLIILLVLFYFFLHFWSVYVSRFLRCCPFDELKVWKRQVDNRTGQLSCK